MKNVKNVTKNIINNMKSTTMFAVLGSVFMFCMLIDGLFTQPTPKQERTDEQKRISIYGSCEHECVNVESKQECIDKCLNYVNKIYEKTRRKKI